MSRVAVFWAGVLVGIGARRLVRVCLEAYAEEAPRHHW